MFIVFSSDPAVRCMPRCPASSSRAAASFVFDSSSTANVALVCSSSCTGISCGAHHPYHGIYIGCMHSVYIHHTEQHYRVNAVVCTIRVIFNFSPPTHSPGLVLGAYAASSPSSTQPPRPRRLRCGWRHGGRDPLQCRAAADARLQPRWWLVHAEPEWSDM